MRFKKLNELHRLSLLMVSKISDVSPLRNCMYYD